MGSLAASWEPTGEAAAAAGQPDLVTGRGLDSARELRGWGRGLEGRQGFWPT